MRNPLVAIGGFLLALGVASAGQAAPPVASLLQQPATELFRAILKDYRVYAETLWCSAAGHPDLGYWGSGRADGGNEGVRAIANTALVYATLADVERADITRSRLDPALRYAAAIHKGGPLMGADGKQWGDSWQSAMWAGNLGLAAYIARRNLTSETLDAVKRVVAAEADRFIGKAPPDYAPGDTKAEENGWDLAAPSSALLLMPDHPHAAQWREAASRYGFNTLSVKADQTSDKMVDGKPLREWVTTANLFLDFTLENHGFFHPVYAIVAAAELGQAAMTLKMGGQNVPEAFRHNVLPEWETLKYVALPDGEWIYPQGLDWALHDYEHIHYFSMLATLYRLPEAALLEQRLAAYARHRQMLNGDGRLVGDMTDLGFTREAVAAERIAVALWQHRLFGPAPAPAPAQWQRLVAGLKPVRVFDRAGFALHRTGNGLTSFSWKNRLMAVVMPDSSGHIEQPYITTPLLNGLVGSFDITAGGAKTKPSVAVTATDVQARDDAFVITASAAMNEGALTQRMVIASLPTGTVVYVDRVTAEKAVTVTQARGLPLGIENDPVSGGTVRLYYAGGDTLRRGGDAGDLAVPGHWANVKGSLGFIVPDSRMVYRSVGKPNRPGAREDILFGALEAKPRSYGRREEVCRRAAIILPNATPAATARVAASTRVDRGDIGTSITFQDMDGRRWMVNLQDDGRAYIPGLTPEPQ